MGLGIGKKITDDLRHLNWCNKCNNQSALLKAMGTEISQTSSNPHALSPWQHVFTMSLARFFGNNPSQNQLYRERASHRRSWPGVPYTKVEMMGTGSKPGRFLHPWGGRTETMHPEEKRLYCAFSDPVASNSMDNKEAASRGRVSWEQVEVTA
jgi:hypothetical protein